MASALSRPALLFALGALGAASCKGSLGAEAKMSAELDAPDQGGTLDAEPASDVEELEEGGVSRSLAKPSSNSANVPTSANDAPLPPLYGARHDVSVRSTNGAVACRCVNVLVGPPTMTQVQWQGEVPLSKPEEQLLVAFAPDAECPGMPEGSQGGSYWGYRVSGKDVIVLLEAWQPEGKKTPPPRTIAALIPRPAVGGQVYIAPVNAKLPFGSSVDGTEPRCALGNPGPARTTPLVQPPEPEDTEGG